MKSGRKLRKAGVWGPPKATDPNELLALAGGWTGGGPHGKRSRQRPSLPLRHWHSLPLAAAGSSAKNLPDQAGPCPPHGVCSAGCCAHSKDSCQCVLVHCLYDGSIPPSFKPVACLPPPPLLPGAGPRPAGRRTPLWQTGGRTKTCCCGQRDHADQSGLWWRQGSQRGVLCCRPRRQVCRDRAAAS